MNEQDLINAATVSAIANSCNIGAGYLDYLASGVQEQTAVIRAVAAGLRDATKNVDPHLGEVMISIISSCSNYCRLKDEGRGPEYYDFFFDQIKAGLIEYRKYEVNTFDAVLRAG